MTSNFDINDVIGLKIGRYFIESYSHRDNNRKHFYNCICDCGTKRKINRHRILSKSIYSCGCYRLEVVSMDAGIACWNAYYNKYKHTAKKRNYEFSLSLDQFKDICNSNCFYCDLKPHKPFNNGGQFRDIILINGIDRIDNDLGYTEFNTVPCCEQCNKAKRVLGIEDFQMWIARVYNNFCITK